MIAYQALLALARLLGWCILAPFWLVAKAVEVFTRWMR